MPTVCESDPNFETGLSIAWNVLGLGDPERGNLTPTKISPPCEQNLGSRNRNSRKDFVESHSYGRRLTYCLLLEALYISIRYGRVNAG